METQEFVEKAAVANRFEIETSRMAVDAAQESGVREFARLMIDDHTEAAGNLKNATEDAGPFRIPPELDAEHQQKLDRLKEVEGADFDKRYVELQAEAHDTAVELFSAYANNGDEGPVRAFARDTLPTLEQHQHAIAAIAQGLPA